MDHLGGHFTFHHRRWMVDHPSDAGPLADRAGYVLRRRGRVLRLHGLHDGERRKSSAQGLGQ